MKRALIPQQKKVLSYARDRREHYGQNDKAARRLVPLRKAQANRRLRRADRQALLDADAAAEDLPLNRAKPDWQKAPGQILREDVTAKLAERRELDGTPVTGWPGRGRLNRIDLDELMARMLRRAKRATKPAPPPSDTSEDQE